MTTATMALTELTEKGADIDVLRQMVQFMAQRPAQRGSRLYHLPAVGVMDKILSKVLQSPYERLDLRPAVCPQDYTGDVIHDTLGRRISPSLFRAR